MPDVITNNIDLWASALLTKSTAGRGTNGKVEAYGIKKLRELILELAVRGKLIPQNPEDEPASVTLARIGKEKSRLIKEGTIKKEKLLPQITDYEKPFALPNGWEWSRLQDVSSYIQRGKGPQYADSGKVRVISQKCIQWAGFDLTQARFVDDDSLESYQPERFLRKGDLLWNSTGTGTAGRINVVPEVDSNSLVADSHVTIIRPIIVSSSFLSCYVAAPGIQQRIEPGHENSLVSGTTNQVELNLSAAVQLVVPIPPLVEQHHIVAKVDELMALCDQLEQQQTTGGEAHQTLVEILLGTLTSAESPKEFTEAWTRIANHFDTLFITEQSIAQLKQIILQLAVMGKLVPQNPDDEPAILLLEKIQKRRAELHKLYQLPKPSEPTRIDYDSKIQLPDSWVFVRIGELCLSIVPQRDKPLSFSGNIPWVTLPCFSENAINLNQGYDQTGLSLDEVAKYRLRIVPAGSVLMSCIGRFGLVALIDQDVVPNQQLHGFCFPSELLDGRFLCYTIMAQKNYLESQATTTTIAYLNKTKCESVPVALPPLAEQHHIVAKVDELMALCDDLKTRLVSAQTTQINLADAIVEQAVA